MTPEEVKDLIKSTGNLDITYLGSRESSLGVEENIGLNDQKRLTHVLNVGPTGYGKSQLLTHVALQDAEKDHGLAVINPKGDLIDELLAKLPEDREDDLVYINPAADPVTPINVLEPHVTEDMSEAQRENQKEIIVSDLIDLFKRQSENWGDQFGRVLETLLRAHLDLNIKNDAGNSLLDVFRCVVNQEQLTELIDDTDDQVIREQLVRVKEDMTSYEMEPLQRRLNDFVMNPVIRKVIGPEESGVNFRNVVDNSKILLVDIQKGEVGETVSQLVGSIVTTKIWAAAQSRVTQPVEQRTPFYLYVDELQNFGGEGSNFTKILSEAREYRLGCWLATQYLQQLATDMRRAVVNNCRTKIAFNPSGSEDETRIAGMFQGISKTQLKALGKYRAAVQKPSEKSHNSATLFDTYPPWEADYSNVDQLKTQGTTAAQSTAKVKTSQSLGQGNNAGGDKHQELLAEAKKQLEERGFQVNRLYQDQGSDKPDGHVHLPSGDIAHLEAEHSTLSKPVKVLRNLERATEKDREVFYVVKHGKTAKLQNIVDDPKNRRADQYQDEQGSYSYYTDKKGEAYTEFEKLEDAEYRIIEIQDDNLEVHDEAVTPECPELDTNSEEDLKAFCLHRDEDGFCNELEQKCVLQADD
jgi:hypothetical protein